ncbi:TPA: acetyl-CoA carboxylase biotin carboxyl carrier protein subunit [Clostridioides difficile]|uniref:acetyl-CoA carboxylase biotin carboxyl carrier protein n=1 Tax=Clostridioides difficile TaxID=1496 RepID=UPI00038CF5F8|nr:biotin/lipoyl-containing protein [Clostridioides difficile]EGT4625343.1 acetyl-CoA carboxylase biotin carboxyl carrier protein subunit [Clostridioides difficile]ELX4576134.1 acetyl-CoA carboxylase biotin carboxyl carrier protein subunit [Clostridioides difficile]EQK76251.1 quinolinate phosphoribosyl transferase, N-terminal domain protein [Clostridioides difficile CD113]MBH6986764.1 acetyl-CoA carboxylase biotin carboxyl carrier protein subunit [Clostridioides difficile]MBH7139349.1 acetyl-C
MNVEEVKKIVLLCQESNLSQFKFSNGENLVEFSKGHVDREPEINVIESNVNSKLEEKIESNSDTSSEYIDVKASFVGVVLLESILKNFEGEVKVKENTILCTIEAMKIYNEIKAPVSGCVVEIFVNEGDFVEFNQTLFKIRKSEV